MPAVRNPPDIIDGSAVKSLVEAQALRGATVLGQPGGWAVLVRYGALERAVAAQRARQPRLWRNLNAAASYVRDELLLPRFEVDALAHEAGTNAVKRPDQAERLRKQREAAGYDTWFRAQVQQGLDAVECGDVLSFDEAEADFARMMAKA